MSSNNKNIDLKNIELKKSDPAKAGPVPVIGLTGGIGTGKSTAAAFLADRGLYHIDADAISRQLTAKEPGVPNPVLEEIGRVFDGPGPAERGAEDLLPAGVETGPAEREDVQDGETGPAETSQEGRVIRPDGSLDRAVMARLVFADPQKKQALEDILFREIIAEIRRQIVHAGEERTPVLLDVPLLFESGLDSLCDQVILLTADEEVRIRRVMDRDGCSGEDVRARIRNQMPEEEKLARADLLVDNSGGLEELYARLDRVLEEINLVY